MSSAAAPSSAAAAGALQLLMAMQQHLSANEAAMGQANPMLAAGQQLASMDAGGTASGLGGSAGSINMML